MVAKWSGTFWVAIGLAAVLTVAAGCSDDSSSNGGSDTANDVADTAADTPSGDPDAQEDSVDDSGDAAADPSVDAVEDAPINDVTDDGGGDFSVDVFGDVDDEQTPVDVASDLGTTEFPICPYETESATVDCDALCGAVGSCSGEDAEAFCQVFCATATSILNQGAATALSTCLTTTACEDVPEGQDLGFYCFSGIASGLPANPDAVAACNAVDAALETCSGEASSFDLECAAVAPVLRPEADEFILDCADQACEAIENCVSAAVCDVLL